MDAFVYSFLQVLLVASNTRNVVGLRYLRIFLTSIAIGITMVLGMRVLIISEFGVVKIVGYVLGGALGAISGAYLTRKTTAK